MKKIINIVLELITIIVPFAVFYELVKLFSKVDGMEQMVQSTWWIPFSILTVYMVIQTIKEHKTVKNGVA